MRISPQATPENDPFVSIIKKLEALSEQSDGEVSDDSPGIAPEHIETIFQKGFSTKGGEHGVSLTLPRQQAEQPGGTLTVESEPGVFTQFFVQSLWSSGRKSA
ncbi:ATP-binding protein [Erwinia tracheiphila]|uniref:Molecular chaperone Hsp90 n=1 Tax=Erwinia tracheiphila TaxID=65700 RepID=A0A345CVQ2_9GAMM|nr:ATP-binding protein [Erwinia tracheiphila]AXF77519.1 molecular chaperone Hsp90 [Erwinia tracheiphila]UIA85570.1 ATP-binding protein [Erwinia tracheiphila]UIA94105.1 ATP-binding protein [Erwinia tracheiphila]